MKNKARKNEQYSYRIKRRPELKLIYKP